MVWLALLASVGWACSAQRDAAAPEDTEPQPPAWRFAAIEHGLTSVALTDIWGRSDGTLFAVGWFGTILTFERTAENPDGVWSRMVSPTQENLTAVFGVENGGRFGLPQSQGEVFAVGWNGTVLHLNPNPDDDPATSDARWTAVTEPQGTRFLGLLKEDPFCPDYDGDGVSDDGDGDGWIGNNVCQGGITATCDDNCRQSANGTLRPYIDSSGDGCLGPGDSVDPRTQQDTDGDGRGDACDADALVADPPPVFSSTLFDVWAEAQGDALRVVVVGEGGALVAYNGFSVADAPDVTQSVLTADAWVAQMGLPFRYVDDCDPGTPVGQSCASGRLPPSCPAQCSPLRTTCTCPVGQGQCCDGAASTGAGCGNSSCGPAANACDAASGVCRSLCPGCFRRLGATLHAVAGSGSTLVAVGADGTIVEGRLDDLAGVWSAPSCPTPPKPLDERPKLVDIDARGSGFHIVGAAGAVFRYTSGACGIESRTGAPAGFLAGVYARSGNAGYAVGDGGVLLDIDPGQTPPVQQFGTDLPPNLSSVWVNTRTDGVEQVWMVGGNGDIVLGAFF